MSNVIHRRAVLTSLDPYTFGGQELLCFTYTGLRGRTYKWFSPFTETTAELGTVYELRLQDPEGDGRNVVILRRRKLEVAS